MLNTENIDFSKIIKRLELIKNLIVLEEVEVLFEQINRLMEFDSVDEIKQIRDLLMTNSYSLAIQKIDLFINSSKQIIHFIDPEIEALKLEIKSLETTINNLSNEEAELEKLIHEFEIRHSKELGKLIIKILGHRKEKARGTSKQAETEQDFKSYNAEYDAAENEEVITLTLKEQKELREKYRKASKLCHPDVVNDSQKEFATRLFAELSEAYENNNINKVREILENLEKGKLFLAKSETINEKNLLRIEIEKQRLRVNELKTKIHEIKENDTYKTIITIDNWDDYFQEIKRKLLSQIDNLN